MIDPRGKFRPRRRGSSLFTLISIALLCSVGLAACGGPSQADLANVDYAPLARSDWQVSTPEEQGLDPMLVARLYADAADLETLHSLLVVKNGFLIAEQYFNGGSVDDKGLIQSASKSYISALIGIALEEGCLSSVDQRMIEFFPEVENDVTDPRKREITVRQMLQMRAGYPDEETDAAYLEALYWGLSTPLIEGFPLVSDPGTAFHYSNLTYSLLAILLERACGPDLRAFAQRLLFDPTATEIGDWLKDREGNYIGSGGIHVTARDAASFGMLYLREGRYEGTQIVPANWVHESLRTYSARARDYGWGFAMKDLGYGYGWWTARAGSHEFSFAWGHGGQLIVLLHDLDIVVVTTADPFFGQHDADSWTHEKACMNLVGDFIASLPRE